MQTVKTHEIYPFRTVLLSGLVSILIYTSGFLITLRLSWIVAIPYLVFIFFLEYRLLSRHCVNCYYWGRTCGFGKGRVSSIFFKKGNPSKFCESEFGWKDMIPDLLVSLVPLILGIIILILDFNVIVLIAMVLLIFLSTLGNGYIRGNLTCKYCRQREIGCPAEQLFKKGKEV